MSSDREGPVGAPAHFLRRHRPGPVQSPFESMEPRHVSAVEVLGFLPPLHKDGVPGRRDEADEASRTGRLRVRSLGGSLHASGPLPAREQWPDRGRSVRSTGMSVRLALAAGSGSRHRHDRPVGVRPIQGSPQGPGRSRGPLRGSGPRSVCGRETACGFGLGAEATVRPGASRHPGRREQPGWSAPECACRWRTSGCRCTRDPGEPTRRNSGRSVRRLATGK